MTSASEKRWIRKRDQRNIKLTGVCSRCGAEGVETSRHHLYYSEKYEPGAVMEVCDDCDDKIHGREDSEALGRAINTIQSLTIDKDGVARLGSVAIGIECVRKDGTRYINMSMR